MAILLYANVLPQLLPLTAFSTFYGILQLNTQSIEITGFLYLRFAAFYTFQSIQIRVSPPNESLEPQGFGDSFFAFGVFLALFLALPASKPLGLQGV